MRQADPPTQNGTRPAYMEQTMKQATAIPPVKTAPQPPAPAPVQHPRPPRITDWAML